MGQKLFGPLFALLFLAGCGTSDPPATSNSATPTVVLLELRGTTSDISAPFTAQAGWNVSWSYNCTASPTKKFQVVVYDSNDRNLGSAINESGAIGTGVSKSFQPGTVYFRIFTSCTWHIIAKTLHF
jgi:hypothetical protein